MILKRVKGLKYIKMLPRGVVKPYILPAKGLVIGNKRDELTLLLEEVLFFPEMLAYMSVTDDFIYKNICFEFAPKVFGVPVPTVKCHINSVLEDTVEDEIALVRNSLLDILVGVSK